MIMQYASQMIEAIIILTDALNSCFDLNLSDSVINLFFVAKQQDKSKRSVP
ncbi:MAG: hypothetical protein KatS3mg053_1705 [Candidatus Roseilinea sp.]|nr:MAG: hypothetical protein KatS3mg053_1705 [Candidatus Roseilinea sp.]